MPIKGFLNNKYFGLIILVIALALLIIGFPKDKNVIDGTQKDSTLSNGLSGALDLTKYEIIH